MPEQYYCASSHQTLNFGTKLAEGGEGAIFEISNSQASVAKLYLKRPDEEKIGKLKAMLTVGNPTLREIAAWPQELIVDRRSTVLGFLMPRVNAKGQLHELYTPRSRAAEFPSVDFQFLVHVACNLCRAFAIVHENGQIIGDVNHGSSLVRGDGCVSLIDADSFEIRKDGRIYHCDVATPLFTAPELQGVTTFHGVPRTQDEDTFGLAVLLFQLLFVGRHPFCGVPTGRQDIPPEQAIKERRFAYSSNSIQYGVRPPPGIFPLNTFGKEIAALFETAFTASSRPSAKEWLDALTRLATSLKACAQSPAHFFPNALTMCPWCWYEQTTGARLFGSRSATTAVGTIDLESLWKLIEQSPRPAPDPGLPDTIAPLQTSSVPFCLTSLPNILRTAVSVVCVPIGFAILNYQVAYSLILFIVTFFLWPRISKADATAARAKLTSARNQWEQLKSKWKAEASVALFDTELAALTDAFSKFKSLPAEKTRRLADLNARRGEIQKHRYLDQFRLADTVRSSRLRIPGIGPGRVDVLRSFGIGTADDIQADKIRRIPRFGPELCDRLLTWRAQQEATFRYNPNLPVDRTELNAMNADIASKEAAFISRIRTGPTNLARLNQEIVSARKRLWPLLGQAWDQVKSADVEMRNPLAGKSKSVLWKSTAAIPSASVFVNLGIAGSNIGSTVKGYAINLPAAVGILGVTIIAALYYFIHVGPNLPVFAHEEVVQTPAISAAPTVNSEVQHEIVYVQAFKVNVRAEPSGDARVVGTQNSATKLYVFQRSGNWVQIGNDVPIGWIHRSLLGPTPPSLGSK